jgi:hypothetical protein
MHFGNNFFTSLRLFLKRLYKQTQNMMDLSSHLCCCNLFIYSLLIFRDLRHFVKEYDPKNCRHLEILPLYEQIMRARFCITSAHL